MKNTLSLLAVAAIASSAQAAVLAQFEFTGNDYSARQSDGSFGPQMVGSTSLNNSAANTGGFTTSGLGLSSGLQVDWSPNSSGNPNSTTGPFDDTLGIRSADATTINGGPNGPYSIPARNTDRSFNTTDQTVFFTVTVNPGFELNLTNLTFDSLNSRGSGTSTARVTHSFFVNPSEDPSVNGLAGVTPLANSSHDHGAVGGVGVGGSALESEGGDFSVGTFNVNYDLTGAAFQGLTGTQTFAIRLYNNQARDFGMDNIILNGDVVPVPEPSSFLLTGLAGLALLRRRR